MVVLDQDHVRKTHAVVDAAAHPHGVFFQGPQAGGRFPGVQDPGFRPGHRLDVFAGGRGHSREALDEVEGRALGLQQGHGQPLDFGQDVPLAERIAVAGQAVERRPGIHQMENAGGDIESGQDAVLLGHEDRPALQAGRKKALRSHVTGRRILPQGGFDQGVGRGAVHRRRLYPSSLGRGKRRRAQRIRPGGRFML